MILPNSYNQTKIKTTGRAGGLDFTLCPNAGALSDFQLAQLKLLKL